MASSHPKITLEKITGLNYDAIITLYTFPRQKKFIPTNSYSLIQSMFWKGAWKRAIYADGVPIGFVMLYTAKAKTEKEIFLWRFMIAKQYQKGGNGSRSFKVVLDHIKKTWPKVTTLKSCYIPGPGSPGKFWMKKGFRQVEQTEEDKKNNEIPIVMELTRGHKSRRK